MVDVTNDLTQLESIVKMTGRGGKKGQKSSVKHEKRLIR